MTRRAAAALVSVLGIVGLGGCTSNAAAPTSSTRSALAPAPSQLPTTSPVAVVSASATATPTVHAARCQPGALAVRVVEPSGGGATGEHAVELLVVNTGITSCLVEGYPRVRLRGMADLAVRYVDGQSPYMSSQPPRPVVLAPQATGYVLVAKYRCDIGILRTATTLAVTLPGGSAPTELRIPSTGEMGLSQCAGGPSDPGNVVSVSPVVATERELGP